MIKTIYTALLALFFATAACAQTGAVIGNKPTAVVGSTSMPAGKFYVNWATAPQPRFGIRRNITPISCPATDPNCILQHGKTTQNGKGQGTSVNLPNCPAPYGPQNAYVADCYINVIPNTYDFSSSRTGLAANTGSFREPCQVSHVAMDDPIVWQSQSGKTHGHQFAGNTTTGPKSNLNTFASVGNSTCAGGLVNRTGYWSPFLVYSCPASSVNVGDRSYGCDRSRDGEIIVATFMNFYYKCDFDVTCNSIEWFFPGLRMIAGDSTNTDPGRLPGRFDCYSKATGNPNYAASELDHIPSKAELDAAGGDCDNINMLVNFPMCGSDAGLVDSPDHISHMRYSDFYGGCNTPGYSHLFPRISLNLHMLLKSNADLDYVRLSSDQPKATATGLCADAAHNWCAGATNHADWVNGWDQTSNFMGLGKGAPTDWILRNCYGKGAAYKSSTTGTSFDCHDYLIGGDTLNPSTGVVDLTTPKNFYWLQLR